MLGLQLQHLIGIIILVAASTALSRRKEVCTIVELSETTYPCTTQLFLQFINEAREHLPEGCLSAFFGPMAEEENMNETLPYPNGFADQLGLNMTSNFDLIKELIETLQHINSSLKLPAPDIPWTLIAYRNLQLVMNQLSDVIIQLDRSSFENLIYQIHYIKNNMRNQTIQLGRISYDLVMERIVEKYDEYSAISTLLKPLHTIEELDVIMGFPPQNFTSSVTKELYPNSEPLDVEVTDERIAKRKRELASVTFNQINTAAVNNNNTHNHTESRLVEYLENRTRLLDYLLKLYTENGGDTELFCNKTQTLMSMGRRLSKEGYKLICSELVDILDTSTHTELWNLIAVFREIRSMKFLINQTNERELYHQKAFTVALDQLLHLLRRIEDWLYHQASPLPDEKTPDGAFITGLLREAQFRLQSLDFTDRDLTDGIAWVPVVHQSIKGIVSRINQTTTLKDPELWDILMRVQLFRQDIHDIVYSLGGVHAHDIMKILSSVMLPSGIITHDKEIARLRLSNVLDVFNNMDQVLRLKENKSSGIFTNHRSISPAMLAMIAGVATPSTSTSTPTTATTSTTTSTDASDVTDSTRTPSPLELETEFTLLGVEYTDDGLNSSAAQHEMEILDHRIMGYLSNHTLLYRSLKMIKDSRTMLECSDLSNLIDMGRGLSAPELREICEELSFNFYKFQHEDVDRILEAVNKPGSTKIEIDTLNEDEVYYKDKCLHVLESLLQLIDWLDRSVHKQLGEPTDGIIKDQAEHGITEYQRLLLRLKSIEDSMKYLNVSATGTWMSPTLAEVWPLVQSFRRELEISEESLTFSSLDELRSTLDRGMRFTPDVEFLLQAYRNGYSNPYAVLEDLYKIIEEVLLEIQGLRLDIYSLDRENWVELFDQIRKDNSTDSKTNTVQGDDYHWIRRDMSRDKILMMRHLVDYGLILTAVKQSPSMVSAISPSSIPPYCNQTFGHHLLDDIILPLNMSAAPVSLFERCKDMFLDVEYGVSRMTAGSLKFLKAISDEVTPLLREIHISFINQRSLEFFWQLIQNGDDLIQLIEEYDKLYRHYPIKIPADCSQWGRPSLVDPINATNLQIHLDELAALTFEDPVHLVPMKDSVIELLNELTTLADSYDFCEQWPIAVHLWQKSLALSYELTDFTMEDVENLATGLNNLQAKDDPCLTRYSSGICNTTLVRWFWNSDQCLSTDYNGCLGNKNNFPTENSCMKQCNKDPDMSISNAISVQELFNIASNVDIFTNRNQVDTSTILPDTEVPYTNPTNDLLVLNKKSVAEYIMNNFVMVYFVSNKHYIDCKIVEGVVAKTIGYASQLNLQTACSELMEYSGTFSEEIQSIARMAVDNYVQTKLPLVVSPSDEELIARDALASALSTVESVTKKMIIEMGTRTDSEVRETLKVNEVLHKVMSSNISIVAGSSHGLVLHPVLQYKYPEPTTTSSTTTTTATTTRRTTPPIPTMGETEPWRVFTTPLYMKLILPGRSAEATPPPMVAKVFMNTIRYIQSAANNILHFVNKRVKREVMNDLPLPTSEKSCDVPIEDLITPQLADVIGIYEPMIVYLKNSFLLRWIIGPQRVFTLHQLVIQQFGNSWLDPDLYIFNNVERALYKHCRITGVISPQSECMQSVVNYMRGCKSRWPEVSTLFHKLSTRYCEVKEALPKRSILTAWRENFPYMTEVLGCVVTDGEFDFPIDDPTGELLLNFWMGPLGRLLQEVEVKCKVGLFVSDMAEHLSKFFSEYDVATMDVLRIMQFLSKLPSKAAQPLRCMMKQFYPYCARKGVDLNVYMTRIIPIINNMLGNILELPVEQVTFSKPKNFASRKRRTVMIFGDPHVRALNSNITDYQTCNELELFNSSDSTGSAGEITAQKSVILMKNDFYYISGVFGKFQESNTGTYLAQVRIEFLVNGSDAHMHGIPKLVYMADSDDLGTKLVKENLDGSSTDLPIQDKLEKYGTKRYIRMSMHQHDGYEKSSVRVKDEQSGSIVIISNPYGPVLNLIVRGAEDLLMISSGLLIDGCMDPSDRIETLEKFNVTINQTSSASINDFTTALPQGESLNDILRRRRREADTCEISCSAVDSSMQETCLYDCYQASGTSYQTEVSNSMEDAKTTEEEAQTEDTALMATAETEVVPEEEVVTTEATPTDMYYGNSTNVTESEDKVSSETSTSTTAASNGGAAVVIKTNTPATTVATVQTSTITTNSHSSTMVTTEHANPHIVFNQRGRSIHEAIELAISREIRCKNNVIGHLLTGVCWEYLH